MIKIIYIGAFLTLLSGCMTTSEVMNVGPDTYVITSAACPACGGSSKALALGLQKASKYCATMGKRLIQKKMDTENLNIYGAGGSTLTFRCLDESHPEFQRADGRKDSDVIIENR